jgi:hypothetical protein
MKRIGKKISQLEDKVKALEKENADIKQTMDNLTLKVYEGEQQAMSDTCVIYGTTKNQQKQEDLPKLVKTVASKLGCEVEEEDIISCGRIKQQEPSQPSAIVVQLKSPKMQQKLVQASKDTFKQGTSITTKGVDGKTRYVYVNPYLTMEMRYLFNQAKILKKECVYKYVWFSNNKVQVKKTDADRPVIIKSPKHISFLLATTPKTEEFHKLAQQIQPI